MKLRKASWVLGVAAIVLPAAYLWRESAAFEAWAKTQSGGVCGNPLIAMFMISLLACALLSAAAALLNGWSYRKEQVKRSWLRRLELVGISCPFVVCSIALAVMALL